MVLVKCGECNKEISSEAKQCPHCGHKNESKYGCVPMAIIGFIVLAAIISSEPKSSDQNAPADDRASAIGVCRDFITQSLHDPSSAEFESSAQSYVEQTSPDNWKVQRKARASNGFGALRLSTFECQMSLSNGIWNATSVKQLD